MVLIANTDLTSDNETIQSLENNNQNRISHWQSLAANGDREAQFRLGLFYSNLEPNLENFKQSIYWYDAAAKQGHTLAQYNLGVKFIKGEGVSKNTQKALSLWLQAANAGHMQAQFNVGRAYFLGVGLEENHRKAVFWFEKAAAQGDPKSIDLLQKIKNKGTGQTSIVTKATPPEQSKTIGKPKPIQKKVLKVSSTPAMINEPIEVFSGPYKHNHFMIQLPNRSGINIVEERGKNWLKFSRKTHLPVWIHKKHLRSINAENKVFVVNQSGVYARAIPKSVKGTVLGFFAKNEKVTMLEGTGDWYKVMPSTRFHAWVKRKDWLGL